MPEFTPFIVEPELEDSSAERAGLVAALAQAQAEFPAIEKTKTGVITGNATYKYADLGEILGVCRPILAKHKIAVVQRLFTSGRQLIVETLLMHGNEWLRSRYQLDVPDGRSKAQALGGIATYLKRYAYCAMVGVQAEEDTDQQEPNQGPAGRVESGPREQNSVAGCISAADQKRLKSMMAINGTKLQELLAHVSAEFGEKIASLELIPEDMMQVAVAFLNSGNMGSGK